MTSFLDIFGVWWRFDRYQIVKDRICPAPGAILTRFHPWDDVVGAASMSTQSSITTPYTKLFDVIRNVELVPTLSSGGEPDRLTEASAELVLNWCSQYGLLGLLPAGLLQVRLAPRWAESEVIRSSNKTFLAHPQMRIHQRYFSGWRTTMQITLGAWTRDPSDVGAIVPDESLDPKWPQPGAIALDLDSGGLVAMRFDDPAWSQYFPFVPENERETYSWPAIYSDAFWVVYGEPVHGFVTEGRKLERAIDLIANGVGPSPSERDEQEFAGAYRYLNTLLSNVNPCFRPKMDTGELRQYWSCTSLLSSLAMMALLDCAQGRRPRICTTCKRVFISNAPKAEYCRPTCRGTMQMRRQRTRKRDGLRQT